MDNKTEVTRNFTVALGVPTISAFVPTDGAIIKKSFTVQAIITDKLGIQNIDMFLDNVLLPAPSNMNAPSHFIDITTINEGLHKFKLVASNTVGKVTTIENNFTVVLDAPKILILEPTNTPTITNTFTAKATVTDTYGLQSVEMYLDNTLLPAPIDMANPSHVIDILTISEGVHTFKMIATNIAGKITTTENNFTVAYSSPILDIPTFIPVDGSTVTGIINAEVQVTETDPYGIASVQYTISNSTYDLVANVSADLTIVNYLTTINTIMLPNDTFTFKAVVTNNLGKSSTISSVIKTINGPTVVTQIPFIQSFSLGIICENIPFTVTDINRLGLQNVEVTFASSGVSGNYIYTTVSPILTNTVDNVYYYKFTYTGLVKATPNRRVRGSLVFESSYDFDVTVIDNANKTKVHSGLVWAFVNIVTGTSCEF